MNTQLPNKAVEDNGLPPLEFVSVGFNFVPWLSFPAPAHQPVPHFSRSVQLRVMRAFQYIVIALVVASTSCSRAPLITVINRSPVALTNVTVTGAGFAERIEHLDAGRQHRLTVYPRGESGLRIAFDAGSHHVDVDDLAYIEANGGYRVVVTVEPDFKVSTSSEIRGY